VNFIVDAQLPFALAEWLNTERFNAIHTLSLPNKNKTKDSEVLAIAELENRVILTKDYDFYNSFILRGSPKKLLLVTTGNISNDELLRIFSVNLNQIILLFEHHSLIELTKETLIVHR
jgi:predicted nuclease of predicted toxin-antitoxin system